jgi:hypothetical protein
MASIGKPFDSRTLLDNDSAVHTFVKYHFTMMCADTRLPRSRSQTCTSLE